VAVHRRRGLPVAVLGFGLVALVALVVILLVPGGGSKVSIEKAGRARRAALTKTATKTTHPPGPATFLGPDGVEAAWVIAENKLPGTTNWKIDGPPAGTSLEGFTNPAYAADGNTVTFYISSAFSHYEVQAYRMGYYAGAGGRLVWHSKELTGVLQPSCPVTPTINMVSCDNWAPSFKLRLTSAFVQGDYLFKLVGPGNQQSYIPFTVWDPTSTATYIVKDDLFTEEAWNPFGGYDYYVGIGSCPPDHYPLCSRARVVSFDRPYGYGNGAGDFLTNEYPLVYWAEKHGLDVTYWTDLTVVQHPSLLARHKVLLSLGHDECWSYHERLAVENAVHTEGLNVVFFGASAVLRHVRLQSSPLGPDRELVDYRNSAKDPLNGKGNPLEVTGNTWGSPPASWPESNFVGEMYAGFTGYDVGAQPFVVADAKAWIFRGTGLHNGSVVPGVILADFDHFDPDMAHPSDVQILGHSPIPIGEVVTDLGDYNGYTYSDMTYYTDPKSGGGVFDSGTNNWIFSMRTCTAGEKPCPAPITRKITGNLLWLFGQGPAGHILPSVANYTQFYP
jgi:hypothetical protein